MSPSSIAVAIAMLLAIGACANTETYRTTLPDGRVLTAKTTDPTPACTFAVLAAMPSDGTFAQLAIADAVPGTSSHAGVVVRDADAFRKAIAPIACDAKADAVVGEVNGFGVYQRAILLKRTAATP